MSKVSEGTIGGYDLVLNGANREDDADYTCQLQSQTLIATAHLTVLGELYFHLFFEYFLFVLEIFPPFKLPVFLRSSDSNAHNFKINSVLNKSTISRIFKRTGRA